MNRDTDVTVISSLFRVLPRSKRRAKDALPDGPYPFFTASKEEKRIDVADHTGPALIVAMGGRAVVHYCEGSFSASSDCSVLIPEYSDPDTAVYCYYLLRTNLHLLEAGFRGVGIQHLPTNYLKAIPLPLPNPAVRRQRVGIARETAELKRFIAESLSLLEQLESSLYYSIVKNSEQVDLGDLAAITWGKRVSPDDMEYSTTDSSVSYLTTASIQNHRLFLENSQTVKRTDRHQYVKGEDLILAAVGSTGQVAYLPAGAPEMAISATVIKLSPDRTQLHPRYLAAALKSVPAQSQIQQFARYGGATSAASLSVPRLKQVQIPLPSLDLQAVFSGQLEQMDCLRIDYSRYDADCDSLLHLFFALQDPVPALRRMENRSVKTTTARGYDALSDADVLSRMKGTSQMTLANYKEFRDTLFSRVKNSRSAITQIYDSKQNKIRIKGE